MSQRLVISEWFELELTPEMIQEAERTSGPIIIQDKLLQKANTRNHNGRIYPREILEREVGKYSELVKKRRSLGELDHPDSPIVELKNVSHLVTDIYMKNDEVRGSLEILNTPKGQILKNIIQQGVKIGISSRGVGSLQKESDMNIVQDDFELIAFDAVSSPSTPGAFLVEGLNRDSIDRFNNLRNILHGILKDSYFK